MSFQIAKPQRDELLYSVMARGARYLGIVSRSDFHRGLFAHDWPTFFDLPIGLKRIAQSGSYGAADADEFVSELTLFPYFAHYASIYRGRAAKQIMYGDVGWPHRPLANWSEFAPHSSSLRFCASCLEEMIEEGGDAWWRRAHQLPSALTCPDHGEVLRLSNVATSNTRRRYIVASRELCAEESAHVVELSSPVVLSHLQWLSRESEIALNDLTEIHPDDRREGYLEALNDLGLLNRQGEAKLPAIAEAMDAHWGDMLDIWPRLRNAGRCDQGWLGALLMREDTSPPLHHLLLEGMLAAAP
ncbi:MAG: TniQ family protein [Parvularcula sp.]|nr:TniQ family protein [Parvularcula sp.]